MKIKPVIKSIIMSFVLILIFNFTLIWSGATQETLEKYALPSAIIIGIVSGLYFTSDDL